MKIYVMLPFGNIEPIRSADAYSGGLTGNLTPDYAIFFKTSYKYKFKKASMDSDNYKIANANLGDITNSWIYAIIDPETFSLY